ncbi:hypothetical protein [Collinsella tanakaei]|uniref:hypothetical protein n=1 Tax=Collinsella tanakaei TaxID=626935 RepID=UPI0025A4BC7B|nr:hypothetical protein [Collinsella tanakaei]MDM8299965.1 hypothetical protein [Collinsella tanakaei]
MNMKRHMRMSGTMAGVVGIGAIACGAFAHACLTVGAEAILIFGGFAFIALGFKLIRLGSNWRGDTCCPTNIRPR